MPTWQTLKPSFASSWSDSPEHWCVLAAAEDSTGVLWSWFYLVCWCFFTLGVSEFTVCSFGALPDVGLAAVGGVRSFSRLQSSTQCLLSAVVTVRRRLMHTPYPRRNSSPEFTIRSILFGCGVSTTATPTSKHTSALYASMHGCALRTRFRDVYLLTAAWRHVRNVAVCQHD